MVFELGRSSHALELDFKMLLQAGKETRRFDNQAPCAGVEPRPHQRETRVITTLGPSLFLLLGCRINIVDRLSLLSMPKIFLK